MNGEVETSVYEIVGSSLCVASEDGQKVYDRIEAALKEGRTVSLSFRNITSLTSAFLNSAIGQLYGSFDEDKIRAHLKVQDMELDDRALLRRVVDTAKDYFKDPHRFSQAIGDALGEELLEQ